MYELTVRLHFSSAHRLHNYPGMCERVHGHNWKVEIVVSGQALNEHGMIIDFKDLKAMGKDVIKDFDHHYLNDHAFFKDKNPTSEWLAKYIYDQMQMRLQDQKIVVRKVSLWETDKYCASYVED